MQHSFNRFFLAGTLSLAFAACKDHKEEPNPTGDYTTGVMIVNGGNFLQNNGTISFLKRDAKEAALNIYNQVNGNASLPPVDGRIEGYAETGEIGIVLFDHSTEGQDKAVLVNASSFNRITEIGAPHIENPRDVLAVTTTKAYISNWDEVSAVHKDGFITVINTSNGTVADKIVVGPGPEKLLFHQNKVYVGRYLWAGNNELTILNAATDQVETSLPFGAPPTPVGIDANGKLWVSAANRFYRINTATNTIEATLEAGDDPFKMINTATLDAEGQHLYFALTYFDDNYMEHGSTYRFAISAEAIDTTTPLFNRLFSGLSADPQSKLLYAGTTPSFAQQGYVLRIQPDGTVQDSVKVEISPEVFYFK